MKHMNAYEMMMGLFSEDRLRRLQDDGHMIVYRDGKAVDCKKQPELNGIGEGEYLIRNKKVVAQYV